MKLFGYWRSSASFRARIALNLKGIDYEYHAIDLRKGEQKTPAYLARNPLGLVPAIETDDGAVLFQSLAIIEYLEEAHPTPALLPADPEKRAYARAIAHSIAAEAQPLMNHRIQMYLKNEGGFDDAALSKWANRWPGGAMKAVEDIVAHTGGAFCVGDEPSIADCCLVPQFYAANRFGIEVGNLTRLNEIVERCGEIEAFKKAHPSNQPDAPDA